MATRLDLMVEEAEAALINALDMILKEKMWQAGVVILYLAGWVRRVEREAQVRLSLIIDDINTIDTITQADARTKHEIRQRDSPSFDWLPFSRHHSSLTAGSEPRSFETLLRFVV